MGGLVFGRAFSLSFVGLLHNSLIALIIRRTSTPRALQVELIGRKGVPWGQPPSSF
jgi:hypothetical protein